MTAMAQSIADVLPKVLAQATQQHRQLRELRQRWARAAGQQLAGHSKVIALRRGALWVQVDDPGSGYALSLDKPRLLKRLNAGKGAATIEEILVRAGEAPADPPARR